MAHHPPAGPPHVENGGGGPSDGFLDRFLPRMASNTVAMAGVALVTFLLVTGEDAEQDAALADARQELAQMQHERDRMHALNQELAREVHDADMAAEIARWQLRWTEERLRRVEAEDAVAEAAARPMLASIVSAATSESGDGGAEPEPAPDAMVATLPARATVEALDDESQAWLDGKLARSATGDDGADEDRVLRLDAVPFEPDIPDLRRAPSQFHRDQALRMWKQVIEEVANGECSARRTETARWRCENDVQRSLWPYETAAVDCIVSGNATPDYIAGLQVDAVPSHSVLLDKGALVLCDGALPNL